MIEIKMTNSHYDKTYTVDCGLKDFKARFHNHTAAVGYVEFTDVDGVFVIISPDKFASVEIKESEGTELEPFLGRLGKMAKDIEYMHNFQNEREDIVEYIYKTHEIVKLLKEESE